MGTDHIEDGSPKAPFPRWAKVVIGALVVGFLVIAVISQWSKVDTDTLRFEPLWLLASIPPLLVYQAAQADVALLVLRRLGHPIPPVRGRAIFGAALLARYVPTGVLVFALRIGMNEREGVPKRISSVAMVYEIALGLAGAAIAAIPLLPSVGAGVIVAAVLPIAGVALLHPAPFTRLTSTALRRVGREPLDEVLPFGSVVLFVAAYTVTFWLAGVSLWFTLLAITPVDSGDVVAVIASFGLGFITSMVGFALPGGLGAREAGLVAGLSTAVAAPVALAASALARLVQTAVELIYVGMAHGHARLHRRRAALTRSA